MTREEELEDKKMPLLDHLIELRSRLLWSVLTLLACFGVCYYFSQEIYLFLTLPLVEALGPGGDRRMIFTALTEAFFTYIKVSMWAAFFLAFPLIATQIWMFVAPGLYKNEKRAFLPFLVATPILFFFGAAMAYYFIFPLAWKFFISFEMPAGDGTLPVVLEAKVNEYLSLVMTLIFAFGLSFELPVLLTLLGRVGILSADALRKGRRYAIVGIFVFAAVVTPPDVISQVGLAIPMILLYEVSIWAVVLIERQRARREAELDAENAASG
jgi:sec-independent protein translocase protein TatC